jgi:hypothetical protein
MVLMKKYGKRTERSKKGRYNPKRIRKVPFFV